MGPIKDRIMKHQNKKSFNHWKSSEQTQGFKILFHSRISTLQIRIQQFILCMYTYIVIITRLPNLIRTLHPSHLYSTLKIEFYLKTQRLTTKKCQKTPRVWQTVWNVDRNKILEKQCIAQTMKKLQLKGQTKCRKYVPLHTTRPTSKKFREIYTFFFGRNYYFFKEIVIRFSYYNQE